MELRNLDDILRLNILKHLEEARQWCNDVKDDESTGFWSFPPLEPLGLSSSVLVDSDSDLMGVSSCQAVNELEIRESDAIIKSCSSFQSV